jgi:hypothetical protein
VAGLKLRVSLLVALAVALVLVWGSPPRLIGDGYEYMAQALSFARFSGPSIDRRVIPWIERRLAAIEPRLASLDIEREAPGNRDGRRDFVHFWFYAWLASPGVWLADETGVNPVHAFTLLNLILLGLALRLALPRIGLPGCLLLFGGPIVWWIDKAHTEVFTFSLLMVAMLVLRERPWWSMVALGAAATQNPPIAAALVLVAVSAVVARRPTWPAGKFWAGLIAGLALAALHPAYYYAGYRQFSLLTASLHVGIPTGAAFMATVFDPEVGLMGNFPGLLLVVLGCGILLVRTSPRDLLDRDITIAWLTGFVFMFSAAQAFNVHHGGTPSISRYTFWLMPLATPFLVRAALLRPTWWRRLLWATSVISAAVCCWAFNPSVAENSREPTWLADYLWNRHPGWSNPVPEVFSETIVGQDSFFAAAPVATPGCQKILIAGRGPGMPMWPIPCPPAAMPSRCISPLTFCYANRVGQGYSFVVAPGRYDPHKLRLRPAWPVQSEAYVKTVFSELDWRTLTFATSSPEVIRGIRQVGRVWTWLSPDRVLMVLEATGADPSITLRLNLPMTGRLLDVTSQRTVRELDTQGAMGPDWVILLPPTTSTLLLTLRIR